MRLSVHKSSDWVNPASERASATSCVAAGTEATKESVPVVLADPLVPPAICWLILVIETGADAAPTLRTAVTPVGALSCPESSVDWVTESVKATSRRPEPATSATPLDAGTDCGHETWETTAVKSWPRNRPSAGAVAWAPAGTVLASAHTRGEDGGRCGCGRGDDGPGAGGDHAQSRDEETP
jgi:hypothetical protein